MNLPVEAVVAPIGVLSIEVAVNAASDVVPVAVSVVKRPVEAVVAPMGVELIDVAVRAASVVTPVA